MTPDRANEGELFTAARQLLFKRVYDRSAVAADRFPEWWRAFGEETYMKTMTIEMPRDGAPVQLVLRGGVSPGQAVIVATDEVEIRYGVPRQEARAETATDKTNGSSAGKTPLDLDGISASLLKLRTKKRGAAVNAIRTMFQFTNPITTDAANKILEDLRKRGDLSISPGGAVEFLK